MFEERLELSRVEDAVAIGIGFCPQVGHASGLLVARREVRSAVLVRVGEALRGAESFKGPARGGVVVLIVVSWRGAHDR